ncbi:MAG: glycosyltransferase, partial [Flavobacteriaceae bacterium]|nr:glycosyltransferase [Flavobacteriaceae bacterium]
YSKNPRLFYLKLMLMSRGILKAIKTENGVTADIVKSQNIRGIISDNRLGVFNSRIPSVYITHQLELPGGILLKFPSYYHRKAIKQFSECWIPDFPPPKNISGKMSEGTLKGIPIRHLGPLSRFSKQDIELKYDLLVLLSGPEPQRSLLESKLMKELDSYSGKALMVRGVVENRIQKYRRGNITIYNYLTSSELELKLLESKVVICRSGYSSIMDLLTLEKSAFFIPTPGQKEQEYLAKRCKNLGFAPYAKQEDFKIEMLNKVDSYSMKIRETNQTDWDNLFSLFKGK